MNARDLSLLLVLAMGAIACRDASMPSFEPLTERRLPEPTLQDDDWIVVFDRHVRDPGGEGIAIVSAYGGAVGYVYTALLNGFSGRLSPTAVAALRANPRVRYVEKDHAVSADTDQTFSFFDKSMWGLERIDQRTAETNCGSVSWCYAWFHNGAGVYAYVVDTGLDSNHVDFTGRAKNVFDAFGGSGQDKNGHGTHVAGTIGSRTWGVAKGAYLRGVRVLDSAGHGTDATVIAGLEWIAIHREGPAVVNMSLGGLFSQALNDAVDSLIQTGVFVAVAAGNNNVDACGQSPASVLAAVTVAAAELAFSNAIRKADYSNWGPCVDLYAPGTNVRSTRLGGGSFANSGTSMAAPHVTGTAAIYKAAFGDASQSVIAAWISNTATAGLVGGNPAGTPNKFIYKAPDL